MEDYMNFEFLFVIKLIHYFIKIFEFLVIFSTNFSTDFVIINFSLIF